jgi:hypothetical protein
MLPFFLSWLRSWCRVSAKNPFEGIPAVHREKELVDEVGLSLELVSTCGATMAEAPMRRVTAQDFINVFSDLLLNVQKKVVCDRKLLAQVWTKWDAVEVAQTLDERLDSQVRVSKVGAPIQFEYTGCEGHSWRKRGAGYQSLFYKGSGDALVVFQQLRLSGAGF